jgi:hypothetical protein
MLSSLEVKNIKQQEAERTLINCSEELVEDDRGDELVMDTTLKIGLKNIKEDL